MRRTLIIHLDCPYGENHFNLQTCDACKSFEEARTVTAEVLLLTVH